MYPTRLFAVATLSLFALCAHSAPPSKDADKSRPVPFQSQIHLSFELGMANHAKYDSLGIPVGKRAMIENYSYKLEVPAGQEARCELAQIGSVTYYLSSAPWKGESAWATLTYLNERTLLFFESEAAGSIVLNCQRSSIAGAGHMTLTLTGWLIDAD